mmetsp:Transcript_1894/g.4835  ORF Transcript_1894/g.4835 Transcript_1894/m.4835 type:complete len:227 (+) Transcript_1894:150-830(+)
MRHHPARHACHRIHLHSCTSAAHKGSSLRCRAREDSIRNEALLHKILSRRRHSKRRPSTAANTQSDLEESPEWGWCHFDTPDGEREQAPLEKIVAETNPILKRHECLYNTPATNSNDNILCFTPAVDIADDDHDEWDVSWTDDDNDNELETCEHDGTPVSAPPLCSPLARVQRPSDGAADEPSSTGPLTLPAPRIIFHRVPRSQSHVGRLYNAIVCSRLMYGDLNW